MNGWINLDKPLGMSSAKAVAIVKRITKASKVGHAGTLDPLASGVLPIALGEATKTASFSTDAIKAYRFEITFGAATSTEDAEGEVIETSEVMPSKAQALAILPQFVGEIEQVPPAYSAIKINGKRAYALARDGKAEAPPPRRVSIEKLEFLSQPASDKMQFEVICGKGTYIRSLARDMARSLGTCGHVSLLRRTRVGGFFERNTILLESLEEIVHSRALFKGLFPVETVLDGIPVLNLGSVITERLRHGQRVILDDMHSAGSDLFSVMLEGKLAAIAKLEAKTLKPVRVFNY